MNDLTTQLREVQDRIRSLRQEKPRAEAELTRAREAYNPEANNARAQFDRAREAMHAVGEIKDEISTLESEEEKLLGELADLEGGMPGEAQSRLGVGTGRGWSAVASQIDVQRGELRADVPLASVLAQAPTPAQTPPTNGRPTAQAAPSNRWLFPVLPAEDFPVSAGGEAEYVANDYVVEFSQTAVSGVERAVDQTDEKAVLPVDVNLAVVNARQFALVIENLPSKVLSARRALQDFLSREVGRRLNDHWDAAVVAAVESGSPPAFTATGDLVADVRHAIAEMRDRGGLPQYLVLDPAAAADLDLSVEPGTGDYVFRVDAEGSGSPTWSLRVREAPSISGPTLIDPTAFITFLGGATVLFDPYSGLSTNLVRVRVEFEAAAHRRSVETGVTVIA
ncbi:MAG: hypothetical protein AABM43_08620 [Actinomycetota bacterium]